jgi:hypothetical protein
MTRLSLVASILVLAISVPTFGALVLTQSDGAAPAVYANGGGGGFGGTLGNGSISMDRVGTNLNVSFTPGNALNDYVALYLDTRAGGFLDAQMNDQADDGRRVLSQLTLTQDDTYPSTVLPDFGMIFTGPNNGGNFAVLFELTAGNTNGHLIFHQFAGGTLTMSIPLALLGSPAAIDFFAAYSSGGGYNSNESLPRTTAGANQNGNPGFGDGQFGGLNQGAVYDNFNQFRTGLPEPGTFLVWGLVLMSVGLVVKRVRSL